MKFDFTHTQSTQEANQCARCKAHLSMATGRGEPKPGDISCCIKCGFVMVFEDHHYLREITSEELASLHPETKAQAAIHLLHKSAQ